MDNKKEKYKVVDESNGHKWFYFKHDTFQSCVNCGIIRRKDDKNMPCKGKVKISLRSQK